MHNSEEMELSFNGNFLLHDHTIQLAGNRLLCSAGSKYWTCQKVPLMLQYEVCRNCWKLCTFQIKCESCVLSSSLTFWVQRCNVWVIFRSSSSSFKIWHFHHLMRTPENHSSEISSPAGLHRRISYLGIKQNTVLLMVYAFHDTCTSMVT